MAKATLPTNYQDDILNVSTEGKRKYRLIYNDDNTVSLIDVTPYDQEGSDFGAGDINATNEAVNQSADAGKIIDDPDTAEATTEEGYIAGVQLFNNVNRSLNDKTQLQTISEISLASDYTVPKDGFIGVQGGLATAGYYHIYFNVNGVARGRAFSGYSNANYQITHWFPVKKGDIVNVLEQGNLSGCFYFFM